jgi:hypothetical protein
MKKFLKIETGASGATGEGSLYAIDRVESIALDTSNNAIDVEGFGGAKAVDLSFSVVAGKEAEAAEELIEAINGSKSVVIDALNFSENVRGPEVTAAYTEGDVTIGAAITYTVATANAGCTFEATLTDVNGDTLTDSGTFSDDTTPGLSFDDTGGDLAAGVGSVEVNIFYPNRSDVAKTYTIAVELVGA